MWLQRFTNYLLKHRWQAIALTFVSTFIPVVGIIGILIAALITLCKGIVEGAFFTLAATLPYVISFYLTGQSETAIPLVIWAALGVAVLSNVLSWVFGVMLRQKANWSIILQVAALLGVLVVSVIHLAYPNVSDWWANQLQSYYNQAQTVAGALKKATPVTSKEAQLEAISTTKFYATGFMAAAVLFNAIMQLVVARWWQAVVFNPGMLRRELRGIRLSQLAGILFIASLLFSYLGNVVVLDIMPVLYMLFAAAGLSLIHYLFGLAHSSTTWFWLSVLYITLIFLLPTSIMLVAMLALVDVWFDLRKWFRKT